MILTKYPKTCLRTVSSQQWSEISNGVFTLFWKRSDYRQFSGYMVLIVVRRHYVFTYVALAVWKPNQIINTIIWYFKLPKCQFQGRISIIAEMQVYFRDDSLKACRNEENWNTT